ncbi:helix-turn-helix domain-containing protein [Pseudomonas sp. RTS4]|uniref:helix-turn-helix domain-containing protein n=1 Tax=Pseudomonas sp. RTS4 TaxID=3048644 RepID=UPI002B23B514|nr:helix-turn-helix domain-containing protein [Pseudomonas sp. RTS4]
MTGSFGRSTSGSATVTFAPLAVGPEIAATMTGTTRSTIYDAIGSGELRAFKSGRRRLILVTDLEVWILGLAQRDV